jgi:hypothetical protein
VFLDVFVYDFIISRLTKHFYHRCVTVSYRDFSGQHVRGHYVKNVSVLFINL